jgi:hypothetical protein
VVAEQDRHTLALWARAAKALGTVSSHQIWRVLRAHGIS